jgi:hypothetical protein
MIPAAKKAKLRKEDNSLLQMFVILYGYGQPAIPILTGGNNG